MIKTREDLMNKLNINLENLWGDCVKEDVEWFLSQGMNFDEVYKQMKILDEMEMEQ